MVYKLYLAMQVQTNGFPVQTQMVGQTQVVGQTRVTPVQTITTTQQHKGSNECTGVLEIILRVICMVSYIYTYKSC